MTSKDKDLKNRILEALPQLQCKKCEYKDCEAYANAIIDNNENLDRCEPGSLQTENQLRNILRESQKVIAVNEIKKFSIAEIKHEDCIGCTICIKVCPVDAIIGAKHKIHFIINDQCNGCELCISECPVNCMEMIVNPAEESWTWPSERSYQSKNFYKNKTIRLYKQKKEKILARERLASTAKIKSYIKEALLREENKRKQAKVYE
jgi:electron transport complex protein RnfB